MPPRLFGEVRILLFRLPRTALSKEALFLSLPVAELVGPRPRAIAGCRGGVEERGEVEGIEVVWGRE